MKHLATLSLTLLVFLTLNAKQRVTLGQLQAGWQHFVGQTVCISTPLTVCGVFADSVILAPARLYVPEEHAARLAEGDSADYFRLAALNRLNRISLSCPKPYYLTLGSTIRNLTAQVTAERKLLTGRRPAFRIYKPSKRLPELPPHNVLVCAANIQNYFVHLGGYASANTTPAQHALQCYKVASALLALKADIYALCELEKGDSAPAELTAAMNFLSRSDRYTFVSTHTADGDTISVGFIYNLSRLRPYGELLFAAPDSNSIYAQRFLMQGFEHVQSGGRFVLSLNHLRSKRGTPEESLRKRMANVDMLLSCVRRAYADSLYTDPDLLILGDFNSYAQELPMQTLVRAGFNDLTFLSDSLTYTYSYNAECGALDRVYASPTMTPQVTAVIPMHWNTDFYWSAVYWSKYNFRHSTLQQSSFHHSNNQLSTSPVPLIRPHLSSAAKRNLLFRYSDHDPLLISLQLSH